MIGGVFVETDTEFCYSTVSFRNSFALEKFVKTRWFLNERRKEADLKYFLFYSENWVGFGKNLKSILKFRLHIVHPYTVWINFVYFWGMLKKSDNLTKNNETLTNFTFLCKIWPLIAYYPLMVDEYSYNINVDFPITNLIICNKNGAWPMLIIYFDMREQFPSALEIKFFRI